MAAGLIYRSSALYELAMLGLYGRHYPSRYRAVAGLIPPRSSVLDLCCGPAVLYRRYLRQKSVEYTGLDISEKFVRDLTRRGVHAEVWDLRQSDPLPPADCVVMQASLYHFLPDPLPVLGRMLAAARKQVIVAEPVRNLSSSKLPLLGPLARRLTDPGVGSQPYRFTEGGLNDLMLSLGTRPPRTRLISGGREKLYVIEKSQAGA
ncbi:MAG: class I SAM-dependent methyltransferase [Acidobacteria bacterium]|nr:class I SAM-dependent methyltransferase [Acidobacteriota bacterium]